jgi:hypothetical protein
MSVFTCFADDEIPSGDIVLDPIVFGENERDWEGIKRDSYYFVGYQFAAVGILYLMPESVSGWSDETKDDYTFEKWWENVKDPRWDTDDHYINYILHPYWGAAYYVRARDRGYDANQSFLYSVLMSTLFEFGIEAMFEQPSIQDLIFTPLGGALFGEYMFKTYKRIRLRHANGDKRTFKDSVVLSLMDPLGMINRKVDDIFGRDAELSMRVFSSRKPSYAASEYNFGEDFDFDDELPQHYDFDDKVVGIQFKLTF